jgi:hypothetical protein
MGETHAAHSDLTDFDIAKHSCFHFLSPSDDIHCRLSAFILAFGRSEYSAKY